MHLNRRWDAGMFFTRPARETGHFRVFEHKPPHRRIPPCPRHDARAGSSSRLHIVGTIAHRREVNAAVDLLGLREPGDVLRICPGPTSRSSAGCRRSGHQSALPDDGRSVGKPTPHLGPRPAQPRNPQRRLCRPAARHRVFRPRPNTSGTIFTGTCGISCAARSYSAKRAGGLGNGCSHTTCPPCTPTPCGHFARTWPRCVRGTIA